MRIATYNKGINKHRYNNVQATVAQNAHTRDKAYKQIRT